jgi:hypothetical protein
MLRVSLNCELWFEDNIIKKILHRLFFCLPALSQRNVSLSFGLCGGVKNPFFGLSVEPP